MQILIIWRNVLYTLVLSLVHCLFSGLETSEHCTLTVGGETRTWRDGHCIFFDDSFLHEVYYQERTDACGNVSEKTCSATICQQIDTGISGNEDGRSDACIQYPSRVVLIMDLWHPDLSPLEIDALTYIYPRS